MAIELLVPIGLFVLGMIVSSVCTSAGIELVVQNGKAGQ
jgi:hypothetical protein